MAAHEMSPARFSLARITGRYSRQFSRLGFVDKPLGAHTALRFDARRDSNNRRHHD